MPRKASYLIRFDDICPTMNWSVWRRIEAILTEGGVKPILAVVPENQDAGLSVGDANTEFWSEVRRWQAMGWTIGLHGYQHTYVTPHAGVIGLNRRSEFAGLSYEEQTEKIRRGIEIFRQNGVRPEVWIAPAHSFDDVTLKVLWEAGIHTVSDGFFLYPGKDRRGMWWLPLQLWEFRELPMGVWTVCYHCNDWSEARLERFSELVAHYKDRIVSAPEALQRFDNRRQGLSDHTFAAAYMLYLRSREVVRRLLVKMGIDPKLLRRLRMLESKTT